MGKPNNRFVAKAETGVGWRIWNRKTKRFWGNYFKEYPEDVLEELNGDTKPENLTKLCRKSFGKKQ